MSFDFSLGVGAKATRAATRTAESFSDLVNKIHTGDFWANGRKPGLPPAPPGQHGSPEHKAAKEALPWIAPAYEGGKRSGANALPWPILMLDADRCPPGLVKPVADWFRGHAPVGGYTTASHTPETPRFRLLLELSRPTSASERKALLQALVVRLRTDHSDWAGLVGIDPAQQNAGQISFLPCQGFRRIEFTNPDTPPLDVDALLAAGATKNVAAGAASSALPPTAPAAGDWAAGRPDTPEARSEFESAINSLDPDLPRAEWLDVLCACRAHGWDEGYTRAVVETWSARGTKYDAAEFGKDWRSLRPSGGIGPNTLYFMAREAGWQPRRLPLGDDARNARAFMAEYPSVRFSPVLQSFVVFDTTAGKWLACDECMRRDLTSFAEGRRDNASSEDERKPARRLCSSAGTRAALDVLRTLAAIDDERGHTTIEHSAFDRDGYKLGVPGGTVSIGPNGWTLRAATPDDMLMKSTAVAPTRDTATAAPFIDFLMQQHGGDRDTVEQFLYACGSAVLGVQNKRLMLFLIGAGGTGKSVNAGILLHILGDYADTLELDAVIQTRFTGGGQGPKQDTTEARGKRLVIVDEIHGGCTLNIELIKKITGGDRVKSRGMYKKANDAQPFVCTFMAIGNSLPRIPGQQQGSLDDRLKVLHTAPPVERRQRDTRLLEKFTKPDVAAAILGLFLDYAVKFLNSEGWQLPHSDRTSATTKAYIEASDDFLRWKDHYTRAARDNEKDAECATFADLLSSFRRFMQMADPQARVTETSFGMKLSSAGIGQRPSKKHGRRYQLVLLNPCVGTDEFETISTGEATATATVISSTEARVADAASASDPFSGTEYAGMTTEEIANEFC